MALGPISRIHPMGWLAAALAALLLIPAGEAAADEMSEEEAYHADYIFGVPADPSEDWVLANGGRLYDKWYTVLDADKPEGTHPGWPSSNSRTGDTTFRCKSCHGWDYKGAAGKYGSGSYKTGIKGVTGVIGKDPAEIAAIIGNDTHGFTDEMIPADAKLRIATFLSRGLYETADYIEDGGKAKGDAERGRNIFQNHCAACHGHDGAALNWGSAEEPEYGGTLANENPWEVLHKIVNGHPGTEMPAMRPFPMEDASAVLAYSQSLKVK